MDENYTAQVDPIGSQVQGRHRGRAAALPALPDHDEGADGRGARRRRTRDRAQVIKEHAVAVALAMRQGQRENDLLDRLAADTRLGVGRDQLDASLADPLELAGASGDQVDRIAARVAALAAEFPVGASYTPGDVL